MCRQMRGKIRLLFSYLSILIIGILIYLIVLFVADKHRKGGDEIAIAPIIGGKSNGESNAESSAIRESSGESNAIQSEFNAEYNVTKNAESPSVADKDSLNELPNEINVALDTIDSQNAPKIDSPNVPKNVAVSAVSKAFPQDFVVNTKVLRIRTEPNTDSAVIKLFKEGAVIRISAIKGKWAELENGGWAYLPLLKEHK